MESFESTAFVWRYMSLETFEWMLTNKALYLARMDQFDDPWELAPACHQLGATQFTGLNSGGVPTYNASAESVRLLFDHGQLKRWHFVSCWSAMATESHALWHIYCGKTEGVAVRTTYGRLKLHKGGTSLRPVDYRDPNHRPYRTTLDIPDLAHEKRPMFAYESEVRIVLEARNHDEPWKRLDWDPEQVLDAVFVHPAASESFFAIVRRLVELHAPSLSQRINWSAMRDRPAVTTSPR